MVLIRQTRRAEGRPGVVWQFGSQLTVVQIREVTRSGLLGGITVDNCCLDLCGWGAFEVLKPQHVWIVLQISPQNEDNAAVRGPLLMASSGI